MEHCPLLKATSSFLNQGPPLVSILSQLNPVHTAPSKQFHYTLPTTHRYSRAVYFLQHNPIIFGIQFFSLPSTFCKYLFCSKLLRSPALVPKSEGTPLFLCPVRLTFAATLHTWRPLLHRQPKDAPCCFDKGYT